MNNSTNMLHRLVRLSLVVLFTFLVIAPVAVTRAEASLLETFEGAIGSWAVTRDTAGTGSTITRSTAHAAGGSASALVTTTNINATAQIRINFTDAANNHNGGERPGTWHWQRAMVYLPAATVAQLGANEYLTLGGVWASATPSQKGWYLRVGQNGAITVVGNSNSDGQQKTFSAYGTFPTNQWVTLELGLHTQAGPGVKRAFAFLINGDIYGWYRMGRMEQEVYDRFAMGILNTSSAADLSVYIDQWRSRTTGQFPDGPDNRSTTANVQEQDYRTMSGVQAQYDWSTWEFNPTLHTQYGLYTPSQRLQAGRNLDRMPSVASGWGEIEYDWPDGDPGTCIDNYCAAMIGFRKEINREQNMEVIPFADASGTFHLLFEIWVNGPVVKGDWIMPDSDLIPGRNLPEPGDIIRARWEQVSATNMNVRASYYDASRDTWHNDVIDVTFNATAISNGGDTVNFLDGYHEASSITIDSRDYSIRRYKVGVLSTYPGTALPAPTPLTPADGATVGDDTPTFTWGSVTGAASYEMRLDTRNPPQTTVYTGAARSFTPTPLLLDTTYYWQLRSRDSGGTGYSWGAVRSVHIVPAFNAAPPRNYTTSGAYTLTWNRLTWAASYDIQVDNNRNFSSPDFTTSVEGETLSVTINPALTVEGVYYWRVRGRTAQNQPGSWSAPETFTLNL